MVGEAVWEVVNSPLGQFSSYSFLSLLRIGLVMFIANPPNEI